MDIAFDVSGRRFALPGEQATLLAENLRLFSLGKFPADAELIAKLGANRDWRDGARATADFIEEALVGSRVEPLPLDGKAAEATYWALRLMTDIAPDPTGAAGLREALGD